MTERKTNQSWEFIQRIRKSDARNKFGAKSKNPMDLDETENVKLVEGWDYSDLVVAPVRSDLASS